jgi:hypothetical protein
MNQKEAEAAGYAFGATNAMRVLKAVREHVLWSDKLTPDERRQLDGALLALNELGQKYLLLWHERLREHNEKERARRAERLAAQ